jgi:hypothetical protein
VELMTDLYVEVTARVRVIDAHGHPGLFADSARRFAEEGLSGELTQHLLEDMGEHHGSFSTQPVDITDVRVFEPRGETHVPTYGDLQDSFEVEDEEHDRIIY